MWTACKILWLKENEPDIFRRAFKFLLVEDFLLYRLSGRFATDGAISLVARCYGMRVMANGGMRCLPFWKYAGTFGGTRFARWHCGKIETRISMAIGFVAEHARHRRWCGSRGRLRRRGEHPTRYRLRKHGGALAILATISTHDLDPTNKLSVNVHVVPMRFFLLPCVPPAAWLSVGSAINSLKKKLPKPANKIATPINCWMNLPPLLLRAVKG